MKKAKIITFSALMSALGVTFMLLGAMLEILDLATVLFAALIILVAKEEMGYRSLSIYAVTFTLSLIILPSKLVAVEYAIIGLYPYLKNAFDKRAVFVKWLLRIVYFLVGSLSIVMLMKVFTPDSPLYWDVLLLCSFLLVFFLEKDKKIFL